MNLPPPDLLLAGIGEDGLIELISGLVPRAGTGGVAQRGQIVGIGDDAAVLRPAPDGCRMVTTVDAFVEGTHFVLPDRVAPWLRAEGEILGRALRVELEQSRVQLGTTVPRGWTGDSVMIPSGDVAGESWEDAWTTAIGHRLAMANLSDLASMGARPAALTLVVAAGTNASVRHLCSIARGVAQAGAAAGAPLVGGDTVRTDGPTVLSVTALGWLEADQIPALRSHAHPADRLWMTGTVGSGALAPGLILGPQGPEPGTEADALKIVVEHFAKSARLVEGRLMAAQDQTRRTAQGPGLPGQGGPCMTDVSDGILREAWRLARAARVRVVLEAERIPVHETATRLMGTASARDQAARWLASGEEWELLIASTRQHPDLDLTPIGHIAEPHDTGEVTVLWSGQPWTPPDHTFSHF